jgi:polar amino acid transport system substrate-binding protein
MKKLLALLLLGAVILTACNTAAPAEKTRVLMEDYPPYNYVDAQGKTAGLSTDVVKAIMSKLGTNIPIEVMPWTQAYALTQQDPGVALYSVARTSEREHLFMWVGPIGVYENWLYARKGSAVKVNTLDDAKSVKAIAAVKDEAGQQTLSSQGFINFVYTGSTADGLKKLMAGEVDLWLGTREGVATVAKEAGVNPDDLEPAVFVHRSDLYIAFNKNTAFATVDAWQKALDSIK